MKAKYRKKYKLRDNENFYFFKLYDNDSDTLHLAFLEYMRETARNFSVRRRYADRTEFTVVLEIEAITYVALAFNIHDKTEAKIQD